MDEKMLLVRVPTDEGFATEFASIDDVFVAQVVTAKTAFSKELQRTRFAGKHFFVGMRNLEDGKKNCSTIA